MERSSFHTMPPKLLARLKFKERSIDNLLSVSNSNTASFIGTLRRISHAHQTPTSRSGFASSTQVAAGVDCALSCQTSPVLRSPPNGRRRGARGIERSIQMIRESRELIEKSEALLQECQQLSETPRFTYLRLHLKRAWWQSSPPCCSPRP